MSPIKYGIKDKNKFKNLYSLILERSSQEIVNKLERNHFNTVETVEFENDKRQVSNWKVLHCQRTPGSKWHSKTSSTWSLADKPIKPQEYIWICSTFYQYHLAQGI